MEDNYSNKANSEDINALKALLADYKALFNDGIEPLGVIEMSQTKDSEKFLVTHANKAFLKTINLLDANFPISATKAFKLFSNFSESMLTQIKNVNDAEPIKINLTTPTKQFLLKIKKHTQNRMLFTLSDVTNIQIQADNLIEIKKQPKDSITNTNDISGSEIPKEEIPTHEEIFRSIFHYSPIAIVLINCKLQPTMFNSKFCDILGYTETELLALDIQKITHSEDFENNELLLNKLFKGNIKSFTITQRYIRKNQSPLWVQVTLSSIVNKLGGVNTAIGMVQNINAEKLANEELINSEYKYRTLIENANDGIGLFNFNMVPIIYNTALYEMLGFSQTEFLMINHNQYELFHPDDKNAAKEAIEKVQKQEKNRIEKRLINKDGTYKHYSINYIPVIHDDKPAILIFRRDISKRKAAELQNEEYRLFLETIMENLPVALFAKTTPDFKYLYWNKTMELMTGVMGEDAIGFGDNEIFQSKSIVNELLKEDQKIVKSKSRIEKEHTLTNIAGQDKQVKTIKTLHIPPTGNPIILGISMDITELKNIEKQVEQTDQLLKEAQKITKLGYWEYDPKKDLIFDNKENRQIFGIQHLNYFLNINQLLDIVLPADHDILSNAFQACAENKVEGDGIIRINSNGTIKHISINYKPVIGDSGDLLKIRGTSLDITRIRQSEIALRESENRLKQAEHIAKVGYWNYDYQTQQTEFSDEVSRMLELEPSKDITQFNNLFESVHPDDKVATASVFHKSHGQAQPFDFDFRIITPSKQTKYIKAKGTFVKNSNNELIRSIGTFQDITELKLKQTDLERYSKHLQNIQQLSKTGYIESEINALTTYFSDTLLSILEISEPLKSIDQYNTFVHPGDIKMVNQNMQDALNTGKSNQIQYRLTLKNGKTKIVNEICKTIRQINPVRVFFTRIIQDISYIKEKEFELSKSELQLMQATRTNIFGLWEYNINTDRYIFSDEAKKILNIENNDKEFTVKKMISRIYTDDQYSVKKIFSKSFLNKENYTLTYRIIPFKKDTIRYVKDTGRVLKNNEGHWVIYGTISDITEAKENKQQLAVVSDILNSITTNSPLAIAIIVNNEISYANPTWKTIFSESDLLTDLPKLNKIFTPDIYSKLTIESSPNKFILKDVTVTSINNTNIKADLFLNKTLFNNNPALVLKLCVK